MWNAIFYSPVHKTHYEPVALARKRGCVTQAPVCFICVLLRSLEARRRSAEVAAGDPNPTSCWKRSSDFGRLHRLQRASIVLFRASARVRVRKWGTKIVLQQTTLSLIYVANFEREAQMNRKLLFVWRGSATLSA